MPNPVEPGTLSDLSFKNPLETLGMNREIVRELAERPDDVKKVAQALYRARAMMTHSDKGGADVDMRALTEAKEALEDPDALRLLISEYTKVTNLQGELDQVRAAVRVRQSEVGALSSTIMRMIETSARASLGLLEEGTRVAVATIKAARAFKRADSSMDGLP